MALRKKFAGGDARPAPDLLLVVAPLISGDLSLTVSLTWLKEAAPLLGTACAAMATFAFFRRLDLRRLRETQSEIDAIRAMDWQHFELLISDGFRRLGYSVDNRGWYVPNWGCLAHLRCFGTRPAEADPSLLCMRWRRDTLRTIH